MSACTERPIIDASKSISCEMCSLLGNATYAGHVVIDESKPVHCERCSLDGKYAFAAHEIIDGSEPIHCKWRSIDWETDHGGWKSVNMDARQPIARK